VEQLLDGWCGRNAQTLHTRGEIKEQDTTVLSLAWYV
jgi:hypothetical protein